MREKNTNINNNMVRMEKKSSNKVGLILLMIIFLLAFGYGGYYLWKNWDNINWEFSLPWQEKETDSSGRKIVDGNGQSTSNVGGSSTSSKLLLPTMSEQKYERGGKYEIYVTNLQADDKGYTFDVELFSIDDTYTLNCEKVLIDGFDTSTSFKIDSPMGVRKLETERINKTELDALDITSFNELTLYMNVVSAKGETIQLNEVIHVTQPIEANNTRKGLISIDDRNNVSISYYRTVEDNENTYIYFDFKNTNKKNIFVLVKKLIINDELYDMSSFEESIYRESEKIFSISIPKSSFSKINSFTISFFTLVKEDDKILETYISNEYSRKF